MDVNTKVSSLRGCSWRGAGLWQARDGYEVPTDWTWALFGAIHSNAMVDAKL